MKGTFRQRVIAGTGANVFGQVISITSQVLSLPLFLHYWDAPTYGAWIILFAIPSYLSMADVGMVTAAGNKMTMAMGQHDQLQANRTFQSALVFMLLVCSALLLVIMLASVWLPMPRVMDTANYRLAIAALSCSVILALFGGLVDAIFKATGRYPLGTMLANGIRLGEWGGMMAGLVLEGSFGGVAVGGLVVRALGTVLVAFVAAGGGHGIRWGVSHAAASEVRSIVKPALSFMLFPIAFALSFQGVTLLVGHMMGVAAVATFNTYRTLARVTVQATSVFSHAIGPEFSRLYGVNGASSIINFYRWVAIAGALFAALTSAVLYIISPRLLDLWTHGAIKYEPTLLLIMLMYAAIGGAGHVPRTLLLATNKHSVLALFILATSVALFILAAITGKIWGLTGFGMAMLISEIGATWICIFLAHRLLNPVSKV